MKEKKEKLFPNRSKIKRKRKGKKGFLPVARHFSRKGDHLNAASREENSGRKREGHLEYRKV